VPIEGYEELLNDNEKGIDKQFIIDLFHKLEEESSSDSGDWKEEKLAGNDDIKAWKNIKGTEFNRDIPCIRVDWVCDSMISVDNLMRALYDKETRLKWDSKCEDIIEVTKSHPNLTVVINRNPKVMFLDARQFIDKRITFRCLEENVSF